MAPAVAEIISPSKSPPNFPRISSPFCFVASLGSLCFPLTRQKTKKLLPGVLIPA